MLKGQPDTDRLDTSSLELDQVDPQLDSNCEAHISRQCGPQNSCFRVLVIDKELDPSHAVTNPTFSSKGNKPHRVQ